MRRTRGERRKERMRLTGRSVVMYAEYSVSVVTRRATGSCFREVERISSVQNGSMMKRGN